MNIYRVEWFNQEKYQQEYFFSAENAIERYCQLRDPFSNIEASADALSEVTVEKLTTEDDPEE